MEITNDLLWMIGGPQGSGVDSSATLFARSIAGAGLWVFGKREYHSNIMGEHSYFQVRVNDRPVHSHIDPVHLLATFEPSTAEIHAHEIVPGGALIYDPSMVKLEALSLQPGVLTVPISYNGILSELARETGQDQAKLAIMKNVIAVAASLALLKLDFSYVQKAIEGTFTGRRARLVGQNVAVTRKSFSAVTEAAIRDFPYRVVPLPDTPKRFLVNGTTTAALGKLKAGCRLQTYYPITPASDESVYLEGHPEYNIVVVQTEDEISAITMATGAALTGVRASTSTSGPGFSLMAEGLGWAAINEVPIVVFDYQRGGPSTGLPTRHEQADLQFALHAGHGEFPRIVLAPGDLEEYFADAFRAFNLAERYQTPVIVLNDKALANTTQTVFPFDESDLRIERSIMAQLNGNAPTNGPGFPRFAITESGISPRVLPGQKGGVHWLTGDEHNEVGHITEEPHTRLEMQAKRMRKTELAALEIPRDSQWRLYGPERADVTIVGWGSTKGAVIDAIEELETEGLHANFLQIRLLCPFPADAVRRILEGAKTVVDIEANYTGQLASLIREHTGFYVQHRVLKWTGRPISQTEVVSAIKEIAEKKTERVVLTYGL